MKREHDPHIVGERLPSGDFFRASRIERDGSVLLGPSACDPRGAVEALDRDVAAERARGRARRRLPGTLALIALLTGCAHLTPAETIEAGREATKEAKQRVEALAVIVATARTVCDSLGDREPEQCKLLDDVPIDKARQALLDADAAQMIAQDVLQALAPYADAAEAVLAEAQ